MKTPILTYKGIVYPWHCDHMGHMNVMWYVGKFDEATWSLMSCIGLTPARLRKAKRGMAALEQNVTYNREVLAGTTLEVNSHLIEIKSKTIRFGHKMLDPESGEIVSTTEILAAHLDTHARKAVQFPDDVMTKAQAVLAKD